VVEAAKVELTVGLKIEGELLRRHQFRPKSVSSFQMDFPFFLNKLNKLKMLLELFVMKTVV